MMRWMLLLWTIFCTAHQVVAQEAPVRYDSSTVVLRSIDAGQLDAYRDDPAFQYHRAPPEAQSAWDQFWGWVRDLIFGPLDDVDTGPLLKWMLYAVIALVVGFAVMRLLRMETGGAFKGRRVAPTVHLEIVEDDIRGVDFEAQIEAAAATGDFRRAVRLLYLRTLQRLAAQDLIDWQRDKTNHAYERELRRPTLRRPFADLTYLFEYVWYGDFPVEAPAFEQVREAFGRFDAQVQQEAAA